MRDFGMNGTMPNAMSPSPDLSSVLQGVAQLQERLALLREFLAPILNVHFKKEVTAMDMKTGFALLDLLKDDLKILGEQILASGQ